MKLFLAIAIFALQLAAPAAAQTLVQTKQGGTGLSASGTAGLLLRSNGTIWALSQTTYPDLVASGNVIFATAANTLGSSASFTFASNVMTAPTVRGSTALTTAAGLVGAPSVRLGSDTISGWWQAAGNQISYSVSGAEQLQIANNSLGLLDTVVMGWASGAPSAIAKDSGFSRLGAASVACGNGTAGSFACALKLTTLNAVGLVFTGGYTVATLPAGTIGGRAYVTDQLAACVATGAALTGGGAVACPTFYNGAAWVGG